MNVLIYTPSVAILLSKVLQTKNINQHYWTAKILKAFYDSIESNKEKEYVIKSANKFLTKSFYLAVIVLIHGKLKILILMGI